MQSNKEIQEETCAVNKTVPLLNYFTRFIKARISETR